MPKKISPFLMLCVMGGLAIFSSTMSKNPALPLFVRSLGVSESTLGLIAAASTIVGILVSVPAGILSDIIGRKRVILMAAVVFATAPFLYLLIQSPWQLVMVRVYHGLATAILGPVAMAAVADTFQKGRGEKMAWYSSATMVGRFVAPFVGGLLIFGNDFRWVYLADGFAGLLALLAAIRLPLSSNTAGSVRAAFQKQRGKYAKDLAFVVKRPGIMATSGIEAVQYFAYGCVETFLPVYLKEKMHYSTWEIGILFTAQILAATLTKPIMGKLSDRFGRIPMITAGLALGGVSTGLILFSTNYVELVIVIALFGLGLATVTASTSALVADLSRQYTRGAAMGILSSIMDIGQSAGPIVTGFLITAFSYQTAFASVGMALVAVTIIYGLGMRKVSLKPAVE